MGKSRSNEPHWAAAAVLLLPLLFASAARGSRARERARQTHGGKPGDAPGGEFPLAPGTTWAYQAMLSWRENNSAEVRQKLVDWKMEVEREIPRQEGNHVYRAYAIEGFPRDLDGSHGDTARAESLIVEFRKIGSSSVKFYWIPPAETPRALSEFANPSDSPAGAVNDDELFLELPLERGEKFCGPSGMIRTDQFYCWVVGKPEAAELSGVEGAAKLSAPVAYPVEFLTTHHSTSFDFVPGVGITRYSYQVEGTASDTELKLMAIMHKPR